MSSRRQDGATPTPRSAVSPPWALAYVTIGQRLASARHSTRVLTLHPLSALLWQHPRVTTTTNQPTNPTLSYPILSYPAPRFAAQRNFSLYPTCLPASPFRSSVRRACTYAPHTRAHPSHTKHTSAQEQRTNAERASGRHEREWVGREGGAHKGRWLGSRVTHESHESARRGREEGRGRGKGEQRRWIERMEGEGEGRVHARRVSYNWFSRQFDLFERATGSRVFRARGPQRWRRARPTSRPTPSTRYTLPSPLLSSSFLFSPPPPTSRSPRPKIYGLPRRFFLDRRDPFSGSRSAPASPRIPDHFRENDSVTRWIFSNRVPYLFISRVNVSTVILFSFS